MTDATIESPAALTKEQEDAASRIAERKRRVDQLLEYRRNIDDMLARADEHAEELDGVYVSHLGHVYREVQLDPNWNHNGCLLGARNIARRFPGAVWKKVKNAGACGVIDWVSTIDGMKVIIRAAEKIEWPELAEFVVETTPSEEKCS